MGQLEDLRLFVLVVEYRGISKAAGELNIAKSAVSRRLQLLENRYSATLINRSPGNWTVTEIGRELYQRAITTVDDFEEIDADFKSTSSTISGPLAISVPRDFGLSFLSDTLIKFQEKYPDIQLNVDFDDRLIDLEIDNYDFVIRITPEDPDGVITEDLGVAKHYLCASQSYIKENGKPENLKQLKSHKLIHYGPAKRGRWKFNSESTKKTDVVDFSPSLNSNSGYFLLKAAIDGQGIAKLPDFILRDAFAKGELIPILPKIQMPEFIIYLAHSDKRRINRRMRLFAQEIRPVCEGQRI
jgi:DNA-binding transcriptional LysR family regulator